MRAAQRVRTSTSSAVAPLQPKPQGEVSRRCSAHGVSSTMARGRHNMHQSCALATGNRASPRGHRERVGGTADERRSQRVPRQAYAFPVSCAHSPACCVRRKRPVTSSSCSSIPVPNVEHRTALPPQGVSPLRTPDARASRRCYAWRVEGRQCVVQAI